MALDVILTPELVIPDLSARDAADAIRQLGARLVAAGLVTADYVEAAVAREAMFPTGLPTSPIAVAIPHADPVGIREPAIAVARASRPIPFVEMASDGRILDVWLVFMLALESKVQAQGLAALITALRQPGFLEALMAAATVAELVALVSAATSGSFRLATGTTLE